MKVGDKVVCIEGYSHAMSGLKLLTGEIYTIKDVKIDCCGDVVVDVGVTSRINTYCHKCWVNLGGVFHKAIRFRKLDDDFGAKVCEQIEKTFIKPLIPVESE